MDPINKPSIDELDREETARLTLDFFHRLVIHHALWFAEVRHQFGPDKALEVLSEVLPRTMGIQSKRVAKALGISHDGTAPHPLARLPEESLKALRDAVAVNWLANDGVWFQAVEFSRDMNDAKRCNDTCWSRFSPFEAWSVKRFLGLPAEAGLEGLKQALGFRLYACINAQSFHEESDGSFVFRMDECRVQSARRRKGLDDYPCKSGGLVEFTSFAEAVDPRIRTECIGCPPDPPPDGSVCSWRFSLVTAEETPPHP